MEPTELRLRVAPEVDGMLTLLGAKWGINPARVIRRGLVLLNAYDYLEPHERLAVYNLRTRQIGLIELEWGDAGTPPYG